MKRLAFILLLLAGCDGKAPAILGGKGDAGAEIEEQAIEKGLLPDPSSRSFAGRFETTSELGTDKFCAVGDGGNFRFLAVFGPESKCEGQGTARFSGEKVQITLSGKGQCSFAADYDGIVLRFPGNVEEGCARYCAKLANLSGTSYYRVENGSDAARKALGRDIEKLCDAD
jgi:hypothetical protein